jgi:hypothetical protein
MTENSKEAKELERRILQGKVTVFDLMHYADQEGLQEEMKTADGRQHIENELYANTLPSRRHIPGRTIYR